MKPNPKLSGEERRAAIIQAVRRVFAEKGFHGTTTRELAGAAGVSEALLFKHFPNKEALYSAMLLTCSREQEAAETLRDLEPSTASLAALVQGLVSHLAGGQSPEGEAIQTRLLLRSLSEDGEFARLLLRQLATRWVPKVEECLRAAIAAGDVVGDAGGPPGLRAWLAQHLIAGLTIHLLPAAGVVAHGLPRRELVEQTVRFALRGLGLTEEAIRRCYDPDAFACG
jgi:AcrR family transcriptional regulator